MRSYLPARVQAGAAAAASGPALPAGQAAPPGLRCSHAPCPSCTCQGMRFNCIVPENSPAGHLGSGIKLSTAPASEQTEDSGTL